MTAQQRVVLIVLSVITTTVIFAVAISSITPLMHWLDRHPAAVTVLRMSPLLSFTLLAWANFQRQKRQSKA